jgi:hypothetical protein
VAQVVLEDVQNKEEFYTMKREERRAGRRRRQEFVELELENPNLTANFDSDDPMWDDLWAETTSDNE